MKLYNIQSQTQFFCFERCDWFRGGQSHISMLSKEQQSLTL